MRVTWHGGVDAWRYLIDHGDKDRQVESPEVGTKADGRSQSRQGPGDYYAAAREHGERPGVWQGVAAAGLGLVGEVTPAAMEQTFGKLEAPDGSPLGSRPRTFKSHEEKVAAKVAAEEARTGSPVLPERVAELAAQTSTGARQANHYADFTFSPSKSWSVLHTALESAGRLEEAEQVWSAMYAGIDASMAYLEEVAGYSRAGYHASAGAGQTSGRWTDGHEWVRAYFPHSTSRDGDPQLHVHAVVLNRVENSDGVWRTLDSRAITNHRRAAAAIGERVAEEQLARTLGVEFATRPDGVAREIVGVSEELRDKFSSRRRAITGKVQELVAEYEAKHGKAPSVYVLTLMAEHATLDTRKRKSPHLLSRQTLLERWERQSHDAMRGGLRNALQSVGRITDKTVRPAVDFQQVMETALASVGRQKAVWNRSDLIAELNKALPDYLGGLSAGTIRSALDELADAALGDEEAVLLTADDVVSPPKELRRESDGRSVYRPHDDRRYATKSELTRENHLLALAVQVDAPSIDRSVAEALVADTRLNAGQAEFAVGVLTSGRRVDTLRGPAGTGKSFAVGEVARLWKEQVGSRVVGITVAENAYQVLSEEGIAQGGNLSKFLGAWDAVAGGGGSAEQRKLADLGSQPLVILDEASMMPTPEMVRLVEIVDGLGGKVLVTGDDAQLGSIGAGGAMRLLAERVGAYELDEVRRFAAPWEREASLLLRKGDAAALHEYDRHGRIRAGSDEAMKDAAFRGYLSDTLDGKRSLLIVGDNELASELSSQVRKALVDLRMVSPDGVKLRDANVAGFGDVIQARRNSSARSMLDANGRGVVNRDVFSVTGVTASGGLLVRRHLGRDDFGQERYDVERTLPSWYVAEHVELGYAVTAHGAQGRTVDTGHNLLSAEATRAQLYVGETRGVQFNTAYVVTDVAASDGAPPRHAEAVEVMAAILDRDAPELTAIEVRDEELATADSLARLGPQWSDALATVAHERYRAALVAALGEDGALAVEKDEASTALYRLVEVAERMGRDPEELLRSAVALRELDSAESVAQVLHWRVSRVMDKMPDGRIEAVALSSFSQRTPEGDDPRTRFARDVAGFMDRRTRMLGETAAAAEVVPEWLDRLGPVPAEGIELERWINKAGAVQAYREQYGYRSETDAIGAAPSLVSNPDRLLAWERASQALGLVPDERDVARLTDAGLRELAEQYRREETWAPPHVDDELRSAYVAAQDWRQKFNLRSLDSKALLSEKERASVAAYEVLARQMEDRAAALESVAEAREAWYEYTTRVREAAKRAEAELLRRHPVKKDPAVEDPKVKAPAERAAKRAMTAAEVADAVVRAELAVSILAERNAAAAAAEERTADEVRSHDYGHAYGGPEVDVAGREHDVSE